MVRRDDGRRARAGVAHEAGRCGRARRRPGDRSRAAHPGVHRGTLPGVARCLRRGAGQCRRREGGGPAPPKLGQGEDEDGEVGDGDQRHPPGRADGRAEAEPVGDPGVLVERGQEDRVEVPEARQGQDKVGHRPAARHGRQDRSECEEREQVPLVDPGRDHEEGDRQDRHREQDRPPVVASGHDHADGGDDGQQEPRADEDRRDPPDQGRDLARLVADRIAQPRPGDGEAVPAVGEEGPGVVAVDREVWVATGRLHDLLHEADDPDPERKAQKPDREQAGQSAGQEPQRARAESILDGRTDTDGRRRGNAATTGDEGQDEMPTNEDHDQDRHEDPELGLDDRGHRRQDRRSLRTTPPELAEGEEQEDHPERVDLPPDPAVEPGDRVDQDDRRPEERGSPRTAELADHRMDEPGDGHVGQDRRELDQVADATQGLADEPHDPEHIEVARGVVDEESAVVEAQRAIGRELARPRLEGATVDAEPGAREEDVCDDEPEGEPEGQDHDERPGGLQRPLRRRGASVGHTGFGGSQGGAPPARALRWSGV